MTNLNKHEINLAIFASGGGSNAEVIIKHFEKSQVIKVRLIVTNNSEAGVLNLARKYGITLFIHTREDEKSDTLQRLMDQHKIDFIVLAGYLRKVNPDLVAQFENKMINIHPALLPKFGGKGMFGMNVHRAVVEAKETVSGPTIHFVNNNYDEGNIIEQHSCTVLADDDASQVQKKVLELEHKYFAPCIERVIKETYGV